MAKLEEDEALSGVMIATALGSVLWLLILLLIYAAYLDREDPISGGTTVETPYDWSDA